MARKSLWQIEKELEKARKEEEAEAEKRSHVKKFADPKEWYEKYQTSRFVVEGDFSNLSLREKANIKTLQGCNPPFVLKFARDQVRVKKGIPSSKAIQLLFQVYNLGFLKEA